MMTIAIYITQNFSNNLESIKIFFANQEATSTFDRLTEYLETIFSHLQLFPEMGADFLSKPARSMLVEARKNLIKNRYEYYKLKEYIFDDYIILYAINKKKSEIYLLSIKHQRQLAYDFKDVWEPATGYEQTI